MNEQSKKYAVCWENDCGCGTDYFATPEERDAEIKIIRNTGTHAWPVDFVETGHRLTSPVQKENDNVATD